MSNEKYDEMKHLPDLLETEACMKTAARQRFGEAVQLDLIPEKVEA